MLKKWLFNFIGPCLSMLSLCMLPVQASARPTACCDVCKDECDALNNVSCVDECDKCDGDWLQKLGLLAVAAGVGALAAWGVSESNKGPRGKKGCPGLTGETGPTGPSLAQNSGDDVNFFFDGIVNVTDFIPGSFILLFVETPEGSVITSNPISINFIGEVPLASNPISINNAPFGTYHFGAIFTPSIAIDSPSFLNTTVATSRSSTITNNTITFTNGPFSFDSEKQFTEHFTYGTTDGTVFP